MSGQTFLDTNIVVYTYSGDEPEKRAAALALIDQNNSIINDQLPAQLRMANVIVIFDEDGSETSTHVVLASLRAKPAQARGDGLPMKREELYDRTDPC